MRRVYIILLLLILVGCTQTNQTIEYELRFKDIEGNLIHAIVIDNENPFTFPPIPIEEGYQFLGWTFDSILIDEYYFINQTIESKVIVLESQWKKEVDPPEVPNDENDTISYQITFIDSMTNDQEVITVNQGEIVQLPMLEPVEGYAFKGWYLDAGFNVPFDYNQAVSESLSLYAKWKEEVVDEDTITVVFENTDLEDLVVKKGSTLSLVVPTRLGYAFKGWYLDAGFSEPFDYNQAVSQSLTLYAKWEELGMSIFVLQVGEITENTIQIELIIQGDVRVNGYDLSIVYDEAILEYISHDSLSNTVTNPNQPGIIIFNYLNVFKAITEETVLMTIEFRIIDRLPTIISMNAETVFYVDENYQILDTDYVIHALEIFD